MVDDSDEWGNRELPGFGDDKLFDPNLNRKLAAKEVVKRDSWKKKNLEAITSPEVVKKKSNTIKKQWESIDQSKRIANVRASVSDRWQDPKYQEKQKVGRAERYADPERCGNYKSPIIGTCKKTGEEKIFKGADQLRRAGFDPPNVYACLNGIRKSSKGYTWRRES